jgi:hypothetical protein
MLRVMHELVGLGHNVTRAVVDWYHGETRTSEHIDISPGKDGWTVANDNKTLFAAVICTVLQQKHGADRVDHRMPCLHASAWLGVRVTTAGPTFMRWSWLRLPGGGRPLADEDSALCEPTTHVQGLSEGYNSKPSM